MSEYRLHLSESEYEDLEQERATDDGMPLPEENRAQQAFVSVETAYSQGRKQTYRSVGKRPTNPYDGRTEPRLHEAWDNGRADELEAFA